jgi:hypothetical protein
MADEKTSAALQGGASGAAAGSAAGPWGAAIGGVVGAGLGLFGASQADKQAKAAQKAAQERYDRMMAELDALGVPSIEAQKYVLTDPQLKGLLVPESEQALAPIESEMADVSVDPRLKQAQLQALQSIQERGEGGLTPEDMMQIRQTRQEIAGQMANQDANIIQNLQQRGMGGSGAELAMRQAGGQQALSQASNEADRLAAMQYNAKMQAIQQAGAMAGSMGEQEFGQEAQKASAQDALSRFNQQNLMDINQRNVGGRNQAQASNLAMEQQLEGIRAANRNEQARHAASLVGQDYQNKLEKVKLRAGYLGDAAKRDTESGATQAKNTTALYSGLGDIFKSVGSAYDSYQQDKSKA